MKSNLMKYCVGFWALTFIQSVNAFPIFQSYEISSIRSESSVVTEDFTGVSSADSLAYNYEGIVALGNCSASLIRFHHSLEIDKGLILTNGHCVAGMVPPGQAFVNKPEARRVRFLDPISAQLIPGAINTTRILYATMTYTDLAIYEVDRTYAEIESQFKIRPLLLSDRAPEENTPIEVLSGYWRRGYACSIEKIIPQLKEGDWNFFQSLRYSQPGCDTKGGTSGSPIIQQGTRLVIGVNNTGNEGGTPCSINNPCEVDLSGRIESEKGRSYGQQTALIYDCLDPGAQIQLQLKACRLPRPKL